MSDPTVTLANLDSLDFAKGKDLLPAIVQHADNDAILMLGYMNREALVATLTRRRVVFFSRSKDRLWEKGETSGHTLELDEIRTDCDRDALLLRARPRGPVCHTGSSSCFGEMHAQENRSAGFLQTLESVIEDRMAQRPDSSYTAKLASQGLTRIAQKVGEEGVETALAGASGTATEVIGEVADLLFHVLVLLKARGLTLAQATDELRARHEAPRKEA